MNGGVRLVGLRVEPEGGRKVWPMETATGKHAYEALWQSLTWLQLARTSDLNPAFGQHGWRIDVV